MTALHITQIPPFGLLELQAAIRDVIHWETHPPRTSEESNKRDEAFVRLRQADWHVGAAIKTERIDDMHEAGQRVARSAA